ncbi:MAG: YkoP family protein [Acidobacteriaceae bacterium]
MIRLLRGGVLLIDHLLSQSYRIRTISQDPDCILRIQLREASHTINIGNEMILTGQPILVLHINNHRMPGLPTAGANLAWALKLRRSLVHSFQIVAEVILSDIQYAHIRAIYGASAILSFTEHIGGLRMIQHMGFTVLPYHRPFGKFGEFWENLFSWWLMWAYNPPSLRSRKFWHLQRTEIWMTAADFIRRYGKTANS